MRCEGEEMCLLLEVVRDPAIVDLGGRKMASYISNGGKGLLILRDKIQSVKTVFANHEIHVCCCCSPVCSCL